MKKDNPPVTFCLSDFFSLSKDELVTTILLIEGPPARQEPYQTYRQRIFQRVQEMLRPEFDYPSNTRDDLKSAVVYVTRSITATYYEGLDLSWSREMVCSNLTYQRDGKHYREKIEEVHMLELAL